MYGRFCKSNRTHQLLNSEITAKLIVLAIGLFLVVGCRSSLSVDAKGGAGKCKSTKTALANSSACNSSNALSVELTSSAANATITTSFTANVVFSSSVKDFEASDVAVTNAVVESVASTDNINFTATIKPSTSGKVSIYIPKDVATDSNGNKNSASEVVSATYTPTTTSGSTSSTTATATSTNQAPVLAAIDNFTISYNAQNFQLPLIVTDADSSLTCDSTSLHVTSSNDSLITASEITWSGTAPECFATMSTDGAGTTGTSTLTFTLQDSNGATSTRSAVATVTTAITLGSKTTEYVDGLKAELWYPYTVAVVNNKLYVGDYYNGRTQIWNSIPTSNYQPASASLGGLPAGALTLSAQGSGNVPIDQYIAYTYGLYADSSRLFVADAQHRVLIWNSLPSSPVTAPDLVLGNANFTSSVTGTSSTILNNPAHAYYNNGKVFVSDYSNHRVLIWNSYPTANGQAADVVLGQANFTTNTFSTTQTGLKYPAAVAVYGSKLIVADQLNHRILIWNTVPTTNAAAADVVIGQSNFTSGSGNQGGSASASTLFAPSMVFVDNGKLFVADSYNSRVLIYNSIPTTSGASADIVVGQMTFSGNSANQGGANPTASSLNVANALWVHNNKLIVADTNNNRVLIWNSIPTSNGASADVVVGQPSMTSPVQNFETSATRITPSKSHQCGTSLFAVDTPRNRVLVWYGTYNQSNASPDLVLGQPNLTSSTANNGGLSASTLNAPEGVYCDGTNLFVADTGNHRVLRWTSMPSSNGQAANYVIGQANMTSGSSATTAAGMSSPRDVFSTGSVLYVADSGNNRILKFNAIPASNGASANIALGQMNLTSSITGCTASGLNSPQNILIVGTKVIVSDTNNNRVQIWNSIPGSNGLPSDVTIGRANAATCTAGASSTDMTQPRGLASNGTKLYVADTKNSRILVYNSIPTAYGTAASSVYGQSNFTNKLVNGIISGTARGPLSESTVNIPRGLDYSSGYLYISDFLNQRLIAILAP